MTQEEAYILIGRIEDIVEFFQDACRYEGRITSLGGCDKDGLFSCGDYAEQLFAYVRANNDKNVAEACNKIGRWYLGNYVDTIPETGNFITPTISKSLGKAWVYLDKIYRMYKPNESIEPQTIEIIDLKEVNYIDINSCDSECRESIKEDLLTIPEATDTGKTDTIPNIDLPRELDTERARKYFARAVEVGYMERTDTGYKWTFGGDKFKVRLGYFVQKVYCPDKSEAKFKTSRLPEGAINQLFGVKRIASNISQIDTTKPQQIWMGQIDKLFED